jgi:hypothetical protein
VVVRKRLGDCVSLLRGEIGVGARQDAGSLSGFRKKGKRKKKKKIGGSNVHRV